jgi:hypothetical protein
MKTVWKNNGIWLVCIVWLLLLAFEQSPPGCICVRGENGKPVLWLCGFAGATLGPGLLLLALALPFVAIWLLESEFRTRPFQVTKAILLLMAWVAYVRWDLLALGWEGTINLIIRCRVLYRLSLGISLLAALIWFARPHWLRARAGHRLVSLAWRLHIQKMSRRM